MPNATQPIKPGEPGEHWLADMLVTQRWLLLLVCLALVAALGYGLGRLTLETGNRVFFGASDPNLLAVEALEKTYGRDDNILFVLDSGTSGIFQSDTLAALEELTRQAWQMPSSRRVDSITNFQHPVVDGDDIAIGDLVEGAAGFDAARLHYVRAVALAEVGLLGRLISANGLVATVNVTLNLPAAEKATRINEAVAAARQLRDEFEAAHPQVKIYLAGTAVTEQTLAEVTTADFSVLMPLLFGLVMILLMVLLRSVTATLCTLLAIALSVIAAVGFAGWMGIGLNNVNVSAPTIIMTLAIADCVHLFASFLKNLGAGQDKQSALRHSLQLNVHPIFLTSVTTALGFLTMNFSESPPFQQLGTISAVGVVGALCVTFFVLPALIMALPFRPSQGMNKFDDVLHAMATRVVRFHRRIFAISLVIILGAAAFVPTLQLNDDILSYFSSDVPLYHASRFMEDNISGTQSLNYSLDSGTPGGINSPQFMGDVSRFADWLRQQPEVVNVESFTDIVKRLNQIMHNDSPAAYRLPDNGPEIAQYILLYELSVPYGLDTTNQINADKSALKVGISVHNLKSRGLIQFEQKVRGWLREHAPGLETPGASESVMSAHIGQRNIESMLGGTLVAICLISACLLIAFRSIKFGLLSLIPNLLPAIVMLGVWGAFVGDINMAAAVVFSLTLGIIVDDTIHFLVKYIHARRELQKSPEDSVVYAFTTVAKALILTSFVLASGFLVLVQSDFSVNSTSGLLVAGTVIIALVLDLVFLPAVLIKADK